LKFQAKEKSAVLLKSETLLADVKLFYQLC